MLRSLVFCLWFALLTVGFAFGQDGTPAPNKPMIERASGEGQAAIKNFKVQDGLECRLFAAEPDVANIVAIHRDYQGRMFVCETFRQEKGVEDNRRHGYWMSEELSAQTVQDRIDYIKKYVPDAETSYTQNDDRIRLLLDQDGDGKADKETVFSDRYNRLEMGTGAGVLSYRDRVYYTCIPDLFALRDRDNDGVADERESLHTGYGVRFAFRGHDLHGLIVGPDGRLYFSIGDRGYNISPDVKDPSSGAVFRCELDGSKLEVFCTGLRNPQELAFDDYGNLFTVDNNSDSGDKARLTELVYGGDSGWRMYYQYMQDRGPFNNEKIWHPWHAESPAYIIPPIANFSDGPSGLEYYPGTGFGEDFRNRFFLCDFRGDASRSGIRSFRTQPSGAFWKLTDEEQPIWNLLATDIDFASDGKLYVSDWIFGWNGVNKGRIYTFQDKQYSETDLVKQVEFLLKSGFTKTSLQDLEGYLGHIDQRIRQEAQFELVARQAIEVLKQVATDEELSTVSRVHATWGLEQLARYGSPFSSEFVAEILASEDDQVAIAGTHLARSANVAAGRLNSLLGHANLRVRFAAAMALEQVGDNRSLPAIVQCLVENRDEDPMLRHGAIMALKGIYVRHNSPDTGEIAKLAHHANESVRLALVVALRKTLQLGKDNRFGHLNVAEKLLVDLLKDESSTVVLESARAIYDLPVESGMEPLARLADDMAPYIGNDPLIRRIVAANNRCGDQASAKALAALASNDKLPPERRVDAIEVLADWANPLPNDVLLHDWRPLASTARNLLDAQTALKLGFEDLSVSTNVVSNATIAAAGKLSISGIADSLEKVIWDSSKKDEIRAASLRSFCQLDDISIKQRDKMIEQLYDSFSQLPDRLAGQALGLIATQKKLETLGLIQAILESGAQNTQQMAVPVLAKLNIPESVEYLKQLVESLADDREFNQPIRIEILEAAQSIADQPIKQMATQYLRKRNQLNEKRFQYGDSLLGGSIAKGSDVFYGKTEVSCVRCHRIDGTGGKVGPDLSAIGKKRTREYLLEAIVDPNKDIAEGYTQVKVMTIDGDVYTGIVKSESDDMLVLLDANGKEIFVKQDDIDGRKQGNSSMPSDLIDQLSDREIRDLVEFLCSRQTESESGHE
ncbi:MAG: PVC-type heme-binding CxxCH protein [Planctomycetota bacterium]